ncbi:hypothetical protein [Paenibacillus antarcticus]|uniref:Uncharacterized protein n=1 Tax=Paenibacillus antarcticus TaxID=253703 RepID=A0A168R2E2_9BACL|nr:hypothetical protein [Paenibacillus antarcticus]OAB48499.1 hypothetical protein PBAT_02375 [Paenibacillus antarcticus]
MDKIKVTFSDGSTKTFNEEQTFMAIDFFPDKENPNKNYPSQSGTYGLWSHIHDGLTPSFLEILANSKFFFDVKNPEITYSAQSIVKLENI